MTGEESLADQLLAWFTGERFGNAIPGVPELLVEHIFLSVLAIVAAVAVALPMAVWLGHVGRGGTVAINVANLFRAVPAYGLIFFAYGLWGADLPVLAAVFATIGLAPIFTNAYVGIRTVDPEVRDAAEGLGLTGGQVLRGVELPIAMPVIMAGIRTSAVNIVATIPLAALVGFDGLGRPIVNGLALGPTRSTTGRALVVAGALLAAILAILTEALFARLERRLTAKGLRDRDRGITAAERKDRPRRGHDPGRGKGAAVPLISPFPTRNMEEMT